MAACRIYMGHCSSADLIVVAVGVVTQAYYCLLPLASNVEIRLGHSMCIMICAHLISGLGILAERSGR